jgi:hypothetical protein
MRTDIEEYFSKIVGMPPWNMTGNTYDRSGQIDVVDGCFAFMFTNVGDTNATVNGMVVFPGTPGSVLGDSRSAAGQLLSLYKGNITLAFATPLGAAPLVEIVQLFFLNPDDYKK